MSRLPQNKNVPQAVLYHLGERDMGVDLANVSPDKLVRRAGVRHVGRVARNATIAAGALGLTFGVAVHGFDNSPTVQPFRYPEHPTAVTPVDTQQISAELPQQPTLPETH